MKALGIGSLYLKQGDFFRGIAEIHYTIVMSRRLKYPLPLCSRAVPGDEFASTFLIRHSAQVNAATMPAVETPLHLVCSYSPKKHSSEVIAGVARIAEALLKAGANPNMQDSKGR